MVPQVPLCGLRSWVTHKIQHSGVTNVASAPGKSADTEILPGGPDVAFSSPGCHFLSVQGLSGARKTSRSPLEGLVHTGSCSLCPTGFIHVPHPRHWDAVLHSQPPDSAVSWGSIHPSPCPGSAVSSSPCPALNHPGPAQSPPGGKARLGTPPPLPWAEQGVTEAAAREGLGSPEGCP